MEPPEVNSMASASRGGGWAVLEFVGTMGDWAVPRGPGCTTKVFVFRLSIGPCWPIFLRLPSWYQEAPVQDLDPPLYQDQYEAM